MPRYRVSVELPVEPTDLARVLAQPAARSWPDWAYDETNCVLTLAAVADDHWQAIRMAHPPIAAGRCVVVEPWPGRAEPCSGP